MASATDPTQDHSHPSPAPATAAARHGWGDPTHEDLFDGPVLDASRWRAYDEVGHCGNGRRLPGQVAVVDGRLRITGTPDGDSGAMAWRHGQVYGRWEARARTWQEDAGARPYHPVLILWPDSDVWPEDGEYDFMETDCGAIGVGAFLHYGDGTPAGAQVEFQHEVDPSQWHCYAIEWGPEHVAGFIDSEEWFRCVDPVVQAPGPMHATVQLDNFFGGEVLNRGHLEVDWYRIWAWPKE